MPYCGLQAKEGHCNVVMPMFMSQVISQLQFKYQYYFSLTHQFSIHGMEDPLLELI